MPDLIIFGDSYAEEENSRFEHVFDIKKRYHDLTSYHEILRHSKKFNTVTSYGVGGSDLWSQFQIFKRVYSKQKYVVWFLTRPGRITVDDEHYSSYYTCQKLLYQHTNDSVLKKLPDNDLKISKIKAASEYFLFLDRPEYNNYVHEKIIKDIIELCPQVIFIPAFNNSFGNTISENCLTDVFMKENRNFGINSTKKYFKTIEQYWDIRRNHMTEENHIILATQLLNLIEHNIPINYNLFVSSNTLDFNKYFIKRVD